MRNRKINLVALFLLLTIHFGCSQTVTNNVAPPILTTTSFAKGADISWITEMEKSGLLFYNSSNEQMDCMQVLKEKGMNAIRLRVWVNPSNGWCNSNDVLVKSLRAKKLGMKIMIDFHYSDIWADPGHQKKPAAWSAYTISQLNKAVYDHTFDVMSQLKANDISPEWVQIGNETNDGMLWDEGRASVNMKNFAQFINSGYSAAKAISNSSKVMVHISNGYDYALFRWIFDGLTSNGANWDMIGLSLYPESTNWQSLNTQCLATMNDLVNRYGKEVMVCEVGMNVNDPAGCKAFLTDIIAKTKSVVGGKGMGVFYWEPQCYNWANYQKGAFDSNNKPTIALDAFAN